MPPPDGTGRELKYISQLKESVKPLVVHLLDGTEVRGHIEYYDTNMIKITRPEGPTIWLAIKHAFPAPDPRSSTVSPGER